MKQIKRFFIWGIVFIPFYSYVARSCTLEEERPLDEESFSLSRQEVHSCQKTYPERFLPHQKPNNPEEAEDTRHYLNKRPNKHMYPLSSFWQDIIFWCKGGKKDGEATHIYSLPKDLFFYLSHFLTSMDTLRLSNASPTLRNTFDEAYWSTYLSKIPKAASYLGLNKRLSPKWNRKEFFSHLWYCEKRISLAAALNHPEAVILKEYRNYGVCIGKDQYICPAGFIRYTSGIIDHQKTNKLNQAKGIRNKDEIEKLIRRVEYCRWEQLMYINTR